MSLQQQAAQLWSMLDDLSQNDPAGYRRFIDKNVAEGQSALLPPRPLLCATRAVDVTNDVLLRRLLADADSDGDSGEGEGEGDSMLSSLLQNLKVAPEAGGGAAAGAPLRRRFEASFAARRVCLVLCSWSRVSASSFAQPGASVSVKLGRPFPSNQLGDAVFVAAALHPDTLAEVFGDGAPEHLLRPTEPARPGERSLGADSLPLDEDRSFFVDHMTEYCLRETLRGSLAPAGGDDGARVTPVTLDGGLLLALYGSLGYKMNELVMRQLMLQSKNKMSEAAPPNSASLPTTTAAAAAAAASPPAAAAASATDEFESSGSLPFSASVNRVERYLTVTIDADTDTAKTLDVVVDARSLTVLRIGEAADDATPLLTVRFPVDVSDDLATAKFVRKRQQLVVRAPLRQPRA